MTTIEAIKRLLHAGAGNVQELATAMQAVQMKSPIASKRCLRAIANGLASIEDNESLQNEMAELITQLGGSETRGVLPRGTVSASSNIQGRVTPERKGHWNNYARANHLTLWRLIEETVDKRTGYSEQP